MSQVYQKQLPINYCIDCYTLIKTIEEKINSAICDDCLNIVCNNCVIVDNTSYLCEECSNQRLAMEEEFE